MTFDRLSMYDHPCQFSIYKSGYSVAPGVNAYWLKSEIPFPLSTSSSMKKLPVTLLLSLTRILCAASAIMDGLRLASYSFLGKLTEMAAVAINVFGHSEFT